MTTGNYFVLQPLIIQRLKEAHIPGLGDVLPARDLHLLEEGRVADAVVYVVYDGESIPVDNSYRATRQQLVIQEWLVVLVTKNYASPAYGDLDRAGPMLWAINKTLQGWIPINGYSSLIKVNSPNPICKEKITLYPSKFRSIKQPNV